MLRWELCWKLGMLRSGQVRHQRWKWWGKNWWQASRRLKPHTLGRFRGTLPPMTPGACGRALNASWTITPGMHNAQGIPLYQMHSTGSTLALRILTPPALDLYHHLMTHPSVCPQLMWGGPLKELTPARLQALITSRGGYWRTVHTSCLRCLQTSLTLHCHWHPSPPV